MSEPLPKSEARCFQDTGIEFGKGSVSFLAGNENEEEAVAAFCGCVAVIGVPGQDEGALEGV